MPNTTNQSLVVELDNNHFKHITKEEFMTSFDPQVALRRKNDDGSVSILESSKDRKERYAKDRKRTNTRRHRKK